jgi:S1-C subfamily serine protease
MRPILLVVLAILAASSAATSRAADTTVVKVLAYYPNGDVSQGTGWFVDSRVLVTDYHVIRSAVSYEVLYQDGMVREARLWNWSVGCDLAALELEKPRTDQKYLTVIADSNKAHQNQSVTAISYPHGNRTISQGKLIRAYWSDATTASIVLFGSDLLTSHGGSGGPVLDSQGQVVGMLEAIAKDGDYECFIISANVIWEALQLTGPEHPSGFVTGVTKGLALGRRLLYE